MNKPPVILKKTSRRPFGINYFFLWLFVLCQTVLASAAVTAQGPMTRLSATRAEIVLNGVWQFQPAVAQQKQPGADWGTIQVPGSWFPQRNWLPGVIQPGTGEAWKSIGETTAAAWYERTLEIPPDWAGKEIKLTFERISTDALVLLDGNEVGKIEWPGGTVSLAAFAKPGTTQTLRLYVTATSDAMSLNYMGIGQNTAQKATLDTRGITGDVVLSCQPAGTAIAGIFIEPSVRKKKLALTVEWSGRPTAAKVPCDILVSAWPTGEKVRQWNVDLLTEGKESKVELDWPDPKLWDYKQPNLYTLSVAVKGGGVADEIKERFGFREWRIEGRTLLLNEIPFRPMPVNLGGGWNTPPGCGNYQAMGALLDLQLSRGIGLGWEWPEKFFQRGKPFYQEAVATVADEKGFPILASLDRLNEFVNDSNFKNVWSKNKERWEQINTIEWRKYRNHPSIVGWLLSGNLGPQFSDQNPRYISKAQWHSNEVTQLQCEVARFMHKLDPTRSVMFAAATWPGDIYSSMTYLNFTPLQEREEWLSEWANSGNMPYIAIEFGTPLQNSYMRGRNNFSRSGDTEPWLAEFAAIYFGPEAYKESQAYREKISGNYLGGNKFKSFNFENAMTGDPEYQAVQALFIRNTWRSWRTFNAGWVGMLSWADDFDIAPGSDSSTVSLLGEFQPGRRGVFPPNIKKRSLATNYLDAKAFTLRPGGAQLIQQGQPTLAWIAGPVEAFTAKDHNFRAGQVLKKQAAFINDTRGSLPFVGNWSIRLAGTEIASGTLSGTIAPGTSQLVPFEAALPASANSLPADGEILLTASIGTFTNKDTFPFQVFPTGSQSRLASPSNILLADPAKKTTDWLAALGVPTKPWDGKPAPGAVLIVGRQALSGDLQDKPALPDMEAFVAAGGRVLVMSQDADWLRQKIGFRVTHHSTRRMWPVQGDDGLMAGVSVASLRDWAGSSTMQEAKPSYPLNEFPTYGWRWGQRGVLGAAVIEKPHFTGWRPLFESEFDLQYAPAMELDYGRGRITWCSLDLEDQSAADPAAEKISRNLLKHVAEAPLLPRSRKTIYVGGESGAKLLESIGLKFESKPTLDAAASLAIIAPDAALTPQSLWAYVQNGGRVFFLGQPRADTNYFGARPVLAKNFCGSLNPPAGPEFSGLSVSDLHLKANVDWPVLSGEGQPNFRRLADGMLGLRRAGKGLAIWAQLGPDLLQNGKSEFPEYLRFTRWRQCRAICQMLANLGAVFQADSRVFRPHSDQILLAGSWQVQITQELPLVDGKNKHADPGISEKAKSLITGTGEGWTRFDLPGFYPAFDQVCGEALWKREVVIPADWVGQIVEMDIPAIKSYDTVFWNGQPIGATSKTSQKEDPWNLPRKYTVPASLIRAGTNSITIRQFAPDQQGGVFGRREYFVLKLISNSNNPAPLYHPDYRDEFDTGDEPYRYFRW